MRRHKGTRKGSTLIEFTLVGIPLIFVLISTFEMARGMWIYHTLAYAVKEGTRYTIVHGQDCATPPNSCTVTIAQIASRIHNAGVGLIPDSLSLEFTAANGSITCILQNCLTNTTTWPTAPANSPGQDVTITAIYPFRSIICMFWPGTGPGSQYFGTYHFKAGSRETIQF